MRLSQSNETFVVKGHISRETEKAILVKQIEKPDGKVEDEWFPFSQVREIHRDGSPLDPEPHLVVTRWIAEQKGLIE